MSAPLQTAADGPDSVDYLEIRLHGPGVDTGELEGVWVLAPHPARPPARPPAPPQTCCTLHAVLLARGRCVHVEPGSTA